MSGSLVAATYVVREAGMRRGGGGKPHLAMVLADRSGAIEAVFWGPEPRPESLGPGSFVEVKGTVEDFRGRNRLRITQMRTARRESVDMRDFLPSSYRDSEEMIGYINYFIAEVYDADYSALLVSFFGEDAFMESFCLAPGDPRSHHSYLGGLLEHTVSVATLCQHVAVQHPRLDSDLLVTAALLHDVGKVESYSLAHEFNRTPEGTLLGHVVVGQRMVEQRIRSMESFPREKELLLMHALISHHGEPDWGAPKRPQSAEALVLHHIDHLDARVKGFLEIVTGSGDANWGELRNFFRRPLDEPLAADRE